jgi:hypothetical protein
MSRVIYESEKRITQHYKKGKHNGVDLGWRSNEEYNKVYANCEGMVAEVQDGMGNQKGATGTKSWGNYVYIKHPNGMYSRYAHLEKGIPVKKGQSVDENTVIGIIGNSGNSYGRHLHFEVAKKYSSTSRINPEPYLTKAIYEKTNTNKVKYRTYDNVKNKWLPWVKSNTDNYAGNLLNGVSGLQIEKLTYRVHDKVKNKWLNWITDYNTKDVKGYAGNLPNDIDGLQIKGAIYRVHIKGQGWLNWIDKVDDTNMGYAGIYGKTIDAIQIKEVK